MVREDLRIISPLWADINEEEGVDDSSPIAVRPQDTKVIDDGFQMVMSKSKKKRLRQSKKKASKSTQGRGGPKNFA